MKTSLTMSSPRSAFSLLELSVVLGVIALIAGTGMSMAGGALSTADRITTTERLATIKQSLDSFAKANGYLPCPSGRALVPTDATFGMELRTATTCTPGSGMALAGGGAFVGAVPVRTLGLPDNYSEDAWSAKFTYTVSGAMASGPASYTTQSGNLIVRYGDRTTWYAVNAQRGSGSFTSVANSGGLINLAFTTPHGISSLNNVMVNVSNTNPANNYKGSYAISSIPDATHLILAGSAFSGTDSGTATWQIPGADVAYVVVSHGADGRGATPTDTTTVPSGKLCNTSATANSSPAPCTSSATTTCIDIENCNGDNIFYDTEFSASTAAAASYFDDYIVWGTNANSRTAASPSLYYTGIAGCPTGVCENWCAPCRFNYPGGGKAGPPASMVGGTALLTKKLITSTATSCQATCFWSGTTAAGYVKKP